MDIESHPQSPQAQLWGRLLKGLDEQLASIEKEEASLLRMAQRASFVSTDFLQQLLESIVGYTFEEREEVRFYKEIKPYFFSRVLYYDRLYDLEMGRPVVGGIEPEEYYQLASRELSKIYDQHRFIYRYIRSGAAHLDEKLFFRGHSGSVVALFGLDPPGDSAHPVSYDHVVAHLLAADLLSAFLRETIDELRLLRKGPSGAIPRVTWTDSKTGLTELGYALQAAGVLNNGKIDLKDVMEHLENTYHVKLGNYPRTFQEILSRKTGYTNLVDRLKGALLRRIQHIEDKYDRG
jgi:hypothetical protein